MSNKIVVNLYLLYKCDTMLSTAILCNSDAGMPCRNPTGRCVGGNPKVLSCWNNVAEALSGMSVGARVRIYG